jgi:hypothetical protein
MEDGEMVCLNSIEEIDEIIDRDEALIQVHEISCLSIRVQQ